MPRNPVQLSGPHRQGSFGWPDLVLLGSVLGLLWGILHFGEGMLDHFDEGNSPPLDMGIQHIPYYAGRTFLRMWLAFGCSLIFTFIVGYAAAKSSRARALILPAIDVLQSVPVLGFLSVTVTGFMALFPHSLLGVECASIFAIFTSQVWNMTFGFYHSMVTIPTDLQEAASTYGLNRWQRFTTVEVPASMHSLIWNCMMSFGGGWFFVAQSEAITVLNKNIQLPGLGSYMANALDKGDTVAANWAILAMLVVILGSDQLVWRPLLAWADRFKMELTESADPPRSWFYNLLNRAHLFIWLRETCLDPIAEMYRSVMLALTAGRKGPQSPVWGWVAKSVAALGILWLGFEVACGIFAGIATVHQHVTPADFLHITWLGFLTLLRVVLMTVLATLIWTPIGVWIGSKPRVARIANPIAQIAASFPVNMTFPIVVGFYAAHHISMNWGSIFLIAMGTQWYILFNVIAGAMAIPNDLKEAARTYGLKGWPLWRTLILPSIFPYWITGACTAAGGAWNASIVAEVAKFGDTTLKADGLGAYITDVTQRGDTPFIICAIGVMSLFVVIMNKFIWRKLYKLAEKRYHLD